MGGRDISTYLFAANAVGATFTRLLDAPQVMLSNPIGYGSYVSYSCPARRIMYRIGVYDKKCQIFSNSGYLAARC